MGSGRINEQTESTGKLEGITMAHPLRLNVPGGFYHVTSRGNERREIFPGDEERERFLGYFREYSRVGPRQVSEISADLLKKRKTSERLGERLGSALK